MLKVLSWIRARSTQSAKQAVPADAWRLDAAVPDPEDRRAQRQTRPAASAQSGPETGTLTQPRMAQQARPARQPQPPQPQPPQPQPIRKPAPARPPRPASPKPAASRDSSRVQDARTVVRRLPVQPRPSALEGTLAAVGLTKSFGGRKVVNDVTVGLRRGEAVGLLGPNGAGKTTVFYMIVGLIGADTGKIMLDGHDVTGLPMYRRARLGIGYLPQEPSIFRGLTVEDNIRGVLEVVEPDRARREKTLDALLDEFNIERVRRSPAIALSGGERRRCEIARSLATQPSFMLLDEPFAGIDPIAVGDIQALVRHLTQRGIGVLITDHNVRETLGLVDRAYIVHSGSILMEGQPDDIVESEDVRRLYLGERFQL